MKEHEKPEVQLSIRSDGLDLHLNGPDVERRNRVLRALDLGGTPACVIQPGAMLGLGSVEARELRGKRIESMKPAPQQDDVALQREMWLAYEAEPVSTPAAMGAVLAHLRAQGLMRTPEDVVMASEVTRLSRLNDMLREEAERYAGQRKAAETALEISKAQVRALTQKAEEANTALEKCRAAFESQKAEISRMRGDLAAAEKRAHDAGQEAVRIGTELLDAKKRVAALESNAPKWSGGRHVTQEEWDRCAKMAADGLGSELQAKAAHHG